MLKLTREWSESEHMPIEHSLTLSKTALEDRRKLILENV